MSTKAVIFYEGYEECLELGSDGMPDFVIPHLKAAVAKSGLYPDALFETFDLLVTQTFNRSGRALGLKPIPPREHTVLSIAEEVAPERYWTHAYMVLKDGRVVVDSSKIVNLL